MKSKRNRRKPKSALAQMGEGKCGCGCGAEVTKGRRFKQGHDMRLRPNSSWRKAHPELFKS
jgi:hypothetical protein